MLFATVDGPDGKDDGLDVGVEKEDLPEELLAPS